MILIKNAKVSISLYPNPVKDNLSVNLTGAQSDDYTLIISDAGGKILQTKNCHVGQDAPMINIPFAPYAAGIYMVKITNSKNETILAQKIVK